MKIDLHRIALAAWGKQPKEPTLKSLSGPAKDNYGYRANAWIREPRYGDLAVYVRFTKHYFPDSVIEGAGGNPEDYPNNLVPTVDLANIETIEATGGYLYKFIKHEILENPNLDGWSIYIENVMSPILQRWVKKQHEGKYEEPLEFVKVPDPAGDPLAGSSPSFLLMRSPSDQEDGNED